MMEPNGGSPARPDPHADSDSPVEPPTPPDLAVVPVDPRLPVPGTRIGKYRVIHEIARGGMGVIYKARDTELGRNVAIKFASQFLVGAQQAGDRQRFVREAQTTALCEHDNIVKIYDVGEQRGVPFLVLEYLRGTPLTEQVPRGSKLPPVQAVGLIIPVLHALVAAHGHKIVHRDLKPDNIFLTEGGLVKVLDFGIAKPTDLVEEMLLGQPSAARAAVTPEQLAHYRPLTQRGQHVGTYAYMAPEQWLAAEIDEQTDVWAIGIILFELVAGDHPLAPVQGRKLRRSMVRLDQPMPSVRTVCPEIPDELADIIDGCLRKPKAERIVSAQALLKLLEPLLPGRRPLRADERPYAGLNSFQEADAHRFFGRTREIDAAMARLRSAPLLGIVGPSGVGKSSFMRAGVVPALKATGEPWTTLIVRPGRSPLAALAYALASLIGDSQITVTTVVAELSRSLTEPLPLVERLAAAPGLLGEELRKCARRDGHRILVFVDQFEELYTQTQPPEERAAFIASRAAFIASLAALADDATSPLRLVLAIRSDFLDHVDPALLTELTRGLFFLGPPNREGLRDAIANPAEMAGFRFELPIIDDMLAHLASAPGALPLLQFAAAQLWETRDRARQLLTMDRYREMGGVAGALATHADAVVAKCTAREQAIMRALFLRLVTAERTRALVPVRELDDLSPDPTEVHRVIDRLVDSRLLVIQTTTSERGGTLAGGSIEFVHDSLIASWPLLHRWLEETAESAAVLEQLRAAAKQWQAKGYSQDLLWRGEAVAEARRWRSRFRGQLPDLQRAFLDAAFALAARASRRARLAVIAAMVVLALLASAATVAFFMIRDAEREATAQARLAEQRLGRTQAAEATANVERNKAIDANQKLEGQNTELREAITAAKRARTESEQARLDADAARLRAEDAQRLERRSKRRATASAELARAAAAAAERAGAKLEVLLVEERKRVRELEELTKGTAIFTDFTLKRDGQQVDTTPREK